MRAMALSASQVRLARTAIAAPVDSKTVRNGANWCVDRRAWDTGTSVAFRET